MASTVFKIENGKFALSIAAPTAPVPPGVCGAKAADYGAGAATFSCQITSGALTASPNVTSETIPATWCDPEQTVPQVGVTSFSLDLTFLQDPQISTGLSSFLFDHDTELAYFFVGLDGDNPPKATGQVRLVAGAFGGVGRTALTATVSLPCNAKPTICFGNSTTSVAVTSLGVEGEEGDPEVQATTTKTKAPANA